MSNAITLREDGYALTKPGDMIQLAEVLRSHIDAQKLYTVIQGKKYPHVEAWQLAGACLGVIPYVEDVTDISTDGVIRYRATVRLQNANGLNIGRGVAICSNAERTKRTFDEYAVASMAQTRAVGKAYRLCIGWILKTAGYEATPAEEMDGVNTNGNGSATHTEPHHETNAPEPVPDATAAIKASSMVITREEAAKYVVPLGKKKGQTISALTPDEISAAIQHCESKNIEPLFVAHLKVMELPF